MRILILDDTVCRHEHYARVYEGHEILSCYSYTGFVEALKSSPWDLIHLDHDLGDDSVADTYVDGWGHTQQYTGYHAALRICELDIDKRPKKVIIQSINPMGSQYMYQLLTSQGIDCVREPYAEPKWDLQSEQEKKLYGWRDE